MQFAAFFAAVLCLAIVADGSQLHQHPVERVITLLQDLVTKVEAEGKAEELTYAKFETWCTGSLSTLQQAIANEKATIDALASKVEGKTKENATLTVQLSGLADEILQHQAAASLARTEREKAANLYNTADKDLGDTIAAIQQALELLGAAGNSTGGSLIQSRLRKLLRLPLVLEQLSETQWKVLSGLHADPEVLAKGDYQASIKKYSFKSGNVIELLKELKAKFEDDRLQGTKAETNAQNAFALSSGARNNAIQAAQSSSAEKMSLLGAAQTELASAASSLAATQQDLKADSTSLSTTQQSCAMKKSEWSDRSRTRAEELKALAAGIEVLSKVTGVRVAAPVNPAAPVPPPFGESAPAFIESEQSAAPPALLNKAVDPKAKAINLLRSEARRLHSSTFERFADQVETSLAGPVDEVVNMIQKMIFHLMAEQKDEDDHKSWCDIELQKTNASKVNKLEKSAELALQLESSKASAAVLAAEIQADNEMVSKVAAFLQEATEVRQVGKAENAAAIKDAQDAQSAIAQATALLESFYKGTGMVAKEPYELLQRGVQLPEAPATWSAAYTGVADPKNQPAGVIAVLKAISADFAKMEADTVAQEMTDQKAYDEVAKSSAIEKARRVAEAEIKTEERKRLLAKVEDLDLSLKNVRKELSAVDQYLKDLSPACLEGDSTYEDRKAARAAELAALKEAQEILQEAFSEAAPQAASPSFLAPAKQHSKRK